MGLLVKGKWQDKWYDTEENDGQFKRWDSAFRNWITPDGSAGPTGEDGFRAEKDRYHLYVSYACPWAHRALIYRKLKGLEATIPVSHVHWFMGENGWSFKADSEDTVGDDLYELDFLYELYLKAEPEYSGRVTVPVLWDKKKQTIVSNESSEIIRMLNSAFDVIGAKEGNYYPEAKRDEINTLNDRIYDTLNNGVYKSGFASTQYAYEAAVMPLFETMDYLEGLLSSSRFLTGEKPNEADWRLFPTLYRFDPVYFGHFKCNRKRLVDYPNLWAYTRDLYQWPGISETLNYQHAQNHYYTSHDHVNPTGIVPVGPEIDFEVPHGRS